MGNIRGPVARDGYTDDVQPTLKGIATPGTLVTVHDGAKVLGSDIADKDGNWTIKPSLPIGEGGHTLTARSTDTSGNVSGSSDPFPFTVDTTRPRPADISSLYDDVGPITGQIVNGTVTDDTQPDFEGWAEPGATVRVSDKGVLLGTTTVKDTGYWSFTPTLANGSHALSTQVVDKAGNESDKTAPINFVVDTDAPTVPTVILSAKDNQGAVRGLVRRDSTIDDAQPEFTGTAEAGATVTLMDGAREIGKATAGSTGQWTITPERPLNIGGHHFTAIATDAAGNAGKPSDPFSFAVFTGGSPTGTSINALIDDAGGSEPIPKGGITNDSTPTAQGKAHPGSTVTLYAEDKSMLGTTKADDQGLWNITPSLPLSEGQHTLTAVATVTTVDGSHSEPSGGFQVRIDTTAPAQATDLVLKDNVGPILGSIAGGTPTDDATPTFSGKAEPGATVTIKDKGNVLGTAQVAQDGTWSFTPPDRLHDGSHSLTTTVTDPAGNTNTTPTPAIEFLVDTRQVVVSIDSAYDDVPALTGPLASGSRTNDLRPTFSGKAIPGGTVTISVDYIDLAENVVPGPAASHGMTSDTTAPSLQIQLPTGVAKGAETVLFNFSEVVSGFDASDVALTNAALSDFKMIDAAHYSATVTPTGHGKGTMSLAVAANSYTDVAGNGGTGDSESQDYQMGRVNLFGNGDFPNLSGWTTRDASWSSGNSTLTGGYFSETVDPTNRPGILKITLNTDSSNHSKTELVAWAPVHIEMGKKYDYSLDLIDLGNGAPNNSSQLGVNISFYRISDGTFAGDIFGASALKDFAIGGAMNPGGLWDFAGDVNNFIKTHWEEESGSFLNNALPTGDYYFTITANAIGGFDYHTKNGTDIAHYPSPDVGVDRMFLGESII